ncbi:MAG: hypothetical protein Q4F76_05180, partial [Lachnospiraceae bacterium]|nr:hypothetical protein [Lachnospiraceae bacterium]
MITTSIPAPGPRSPVLGIDPFPVEPERFLKSLLSASEDFIIFPLSITGAAAYLALIHPTLLTGTSKTTSGGDVAGSVSGGGFRSFPLPSGPSGEGGWGGVFSGADSWGAVSSGIGSSGG